MLDCISINIPCVWASYYRKSLCSLCGNGVPTAYYMVTAFLFTVHVSYHTYTQ